MDPSVARRMHRTLEPYHGMIYFVPEARVRVRRHRPHRTPNGVLRLASGTDGCGARRRGHRHLLQLQPHARCGARSPRRGTAPRRRRSWTRASRAPTPRSGGSSATGSTVRRCGPPPRSPGAQPTGVVRKGGRCSPGTPRWGGRPNRISCCGTRRRCCGNAGVTGTSPAGCRRPRRAGSAGAASGNR